MCDARSGNSLQLDFGEGSFARSMQQNSCVLHVTTIYVESNCQSSRIDIGFKNLSTLRTIIYLHKHSIFTLSLGFLHVSPPDLLGICHLCWPSGTSADGYAGASGSWKPSRRGCTSNLSKRFAMVRIKAPAIDFLKPGWLVTKCHQDIYILHYNIYITL